MRERNHAVQWVIPTPVTPGQVPNNGPDMLPISDDGSIDSSLYTLDSESEGGIWDNHNDDNVSIAPEGAQRIPPDVDDNDGTPMIGSPFGSPVGCQNDRDNLPPNIFRLQYKLLRELPIDIVVRQNSTLQLYGDVVLLAN